MWETIDNDFSDYHGHDVVGIPIHLKNISDATSGLNMFSYTAYGSKGTTLETVGHYFDDDINFAGDLRAGAELDSFMHLLYDGDGDYYVEFETFSFDNDYIEIRIPIEK